MPTPYRAYLARCAITKWDISPRYKLPSSHTDRDGQARYHPACLPVRQSAASAERLTRGSPAACARDDVVGGVQLAPRRPCRDGPGRLDYDRCARWFTTTSGCGLIGVRHAAVLASAFQLSAGLMPPNDTSMNTYATLVECARLPGSARVSLSCGGGVGWLCSARQSWGSIPEGMNFLKGDGALRMPLSLGGPGYRAARRAPRCADHFQNDPRLVPYQGPRCDFRDAAVASRLGLDRRRCRPPRNLEWRRDASLLPAACQDAWCGFPSGSRSKSRIGGASRPWRSIEVTGMAAIGGTQPLARFGDACCAERHEPWWGR
jgi:hypothetical protein